MANDVSATSRVYFDSTILIGLLDEKTRKSMSRAGAFIWRRAQTSMRWKPLEAKRGPNKGRPNYARAGSPPFAHEETGGHLRRKLDFAFDLSTKSLVVGPRKLGSGTAGKVQEFGGRETSTIAGRRIHGNWAPRPFMGPSLQKEVAAGNVHRQWAGELRGG